MDELSLKQLSLDVEFWRKNKKHIRQQLPKLLWDRALRAVDIYGINAVVRATKIDRRRLLPRTTAPKRANNSHENTPTFSRVHLSAPVPNTSPLAELEIPNGMKLRIFAHTQETLSLISSLCGIGARS